MKASVAGCPSNSGTAAHAQALFMLLSLIVLQITIG